MLSTYAKVDADQNHKNQTNYFIFKTLKNTCPMKNFHSTQKIYINKKSIIHFYSSKEHLCENIIKMPN